VPESSWNRGFFYGPGKITGKKIPSLWGKNWDEIGVFIAYCYSYFKDISSSWISL
jgi:hypothetical protein